ncbi:hexokinase-domain-containing protein [Cladochytrium replicatum]|nr:hexokinase-domain-containing protein [Cladochytrium replicatum]
MPGSLFTNGRVFLFGLTTGVSLVAAAQYLSHLLDSARIAPAKVGAVVAPSVGGQQPSQGASATAIAVIERIESEFGVSGAKLRQIVKHLMKEMKRGLAAPGQTVKMLPSYVTKRPLGSESGTFLALDLGGTNFRVCEVELDGKSHVRTRQKKFVVPDNLKSSSGEKLFDFFGDCILEFLKELPGYNPTAKDQFKMGFTFSFPVDQQSLDRGVLITWTKGFSCPGVVGEDVVKMLRDSLERKGVNISVPAIVNDTVGTLISHAYSNPQTYVGVILGTGSNAAYVESMENITKLHDEVTDCSGEMVINMEWGAFDDERNVLPVTSYDLNVDRASPNPGRQTFEKLISGMYLGEVVRQVIVDLIGTGELFGGRRSSHLLTPYCFETAMMSRIERDHTTELADTRTVLEEILKSPPTSMDDRIVVKRICELVGTRSARLAAAGISAIVSKINRFHGCTVAIDGSLFEAYPHYGNRMKDAIRELLGITAENVILEQARDGSGQGAAVIAALAS